MEPFSLNLMLPAFCSTCLHLFLLFTLNSLWFGQNTTASPSGNETDHLALLRFKESISSDPYGILPSWNSSTHFCNWRGITCSPMHQRVTKLNLQGYQLHGLISPQVGNLSFLINLNLGNNSFHGKIPQELGRLLQLQQLYLTNNSLTGVIPTNLTSCSDLKVLQLAGNNLIGKIPIEIASLRKLQYFSVTKNNLTGGVPPFIGNLSSLTFLGMTYNNLGGDIPQEICRLKNLTAITAGENKLSGIFPSCFYNMSSLSAISAPQNIFNGSLPPNMFLTLSNLQVFAIGGNQLSGPIPTSISNASVLQLFDINENHFVGQVPSLGNLQGLRILSFSLNNLGDNLTTDLEFLKSLTNCSKLQLLGIDHNKFGGSLPNYLGNFSTQLSQLYAGGNQISGHIPAELGNLNSLTLLTMENNHFEGNIPSTFGKFQNMQLLDLNGNKLSGDMPSNIGNLSMLYYLGLEENLLEGNIPVSIGNCQKLQYLNLSRNNLRGIIPLEVFSISSLTSLLDLSHNSLSGSLPDEVGQLKNIDELDVSENHLSGNIPGTIGECLSLEYLYLQGNSFNGIIPSSLASLKGLRHLDLSRNHLFGSIPDVLQNIAFLEYLNVSFNMLDGEVPTKGVFRNASDLVVTGNNKLCGGVSELHLPPCPIKGDQHAKHHNFRLAAAIVSVVAFLLILSLILAFCWTRKRSKKPSSDSLTIDQLANVSYQNLHHGTDGFSIRNLIGTGSFGSVYKGTIESEDTIVAIKVLNLQKKGAYKSFIAECYALKNVRHRNLVKILTCCSSIDFKGQEFKALVFEYMTNGSLESWLHPATEIADQRRSMNLEERLNIINDVASAVHYLHYECEQAFIHCDLKPGNVLLDDCMVAHVSDFGLARLLSSVGVSVMQSSTIGVEGTIGYAPPEYGMGSEMSIEGDMYSFGILILEMLTARRPTDEMFKDGHTLHNYVKVTISNNFVEIVDPTIHPNELENENLGFTHPNVEKCLLSLFRIALACSMESPKERMNMIDVIKELNLIKTFFPWRPTALQPRNT
ncbi:probable LRR receptor-like serine/threonine-protein kinase At3g47570 [Gastrolobium bilobum]|uniref:probable LRR receptor-like serine/threonine-protein kinase At3g47570 n=1 Tax=Gastrolobium bilobum TaxID=150636 RepID=UPI002AB07698|nr:probable LRR receptor-like serine/threonine-protein kinase At3g47570 [Gastrolobium bilobum]